MDDLFSRLLILYQPGPLPPLSLPMFQGAEVPVLIFPTLQVAQARVWRNYEAPNSEMLKAVINGVCRTALAMGEQEEEDSRFWKAKEEIGIVIALCETLFRPMRAVELSLERLFPGFLFLRGSDWPPSPTAVDQLASDFRHRWKEEEKIFGREWVLAAGATPLAIKQRPALIAPWVAGVTINRWLILKNVPEDRRAQLTLNLVESLMNRNIRPEQIRHWTELVERVLVTTVKGRAPLSGYLVEQVPRILESHISIDQLNPTLFIENVIIDDEACEKFGRMLQTAWHHTHQVKERVPRSKRAPALKEKREFRCGLCKRESMRTEEVWAHIRDSHNISDGDIEIPDRSKEIIQKSTGRIIASWREEE